MSDFELILRGLFEGCHTLVLKTSSGWNAIESFDVYNSQRLVLGIDMVNKEIVLTDYLTDSEGVSRRQWKTTDIVWIDTIVDFIGKHDRP